VPVQRLRRRRRRPLTPQRLDEHITRNHLVRVQDEHRQQRPLLRALRRDLPPVLEHLE
jgi:hypothetical protein